MSGPGAARRPGRSGRVRSMAAAAALLVLASFLLWPEPPVPASLPVPRAAIEQRRADGPGKLNNTPVDAPIGEPQLEGALEITPDRHLLPNDTLREVFDYFLPPPPADKADAALKSYLNRKLPAPAVADALRIAERYRVYMRDHDALLAAQNLHLRGGSPTPAELARLSTWRDQRARLRERSLDRQLVQAWYPDEDLRLTQTIDELQRDSGAAAPARDAAVPGETLPRPVPHWTRPADRERHQEYLRAIVRRSLTSFAALARSRR